MQRIKYYCQARADRQYRQKWTEDHDREDKGSEQQSKEEIPLHDFRLHRESIAHIYPDTKTGLLFYQKLDTIEPMEFAVIQTGGKQYKVSVGGLVSIEKMKTKGAEYKKGDTVSFDKVLLVDDGTNTTIGTPYIAGAKVGAEIVEIGRGRKVMVVKYKQKSRYLRRNGHRQPFFKVKINSIE